MFQFCFLTTTTATTTTPHVIQTNDLFMQCSFHKHYSHYIVLSK